MGGGLKDKWSFDKEFICFVSLGIGDWDVWRGFKLLLLGLSSGFREKDAAEIAFWKSRRRDRFA